ncbi:MAG: hypothetical protein U0559_04950 [Anaerolineae bacterium]
MAAACAYRSTLTIQRATFDHNASQDGGGISDNGTLQLINVTVSGNSATDQGGGLYNEAGGAYASIITMTNVTIKDNGATTAGGGFFNFNVSTPPRTSRTRSSPTAPVRAIAAARPSRRQVLAPAVTILVR